MPVKIADQRSAGARQVDISEPFSITICGLEELPGHCEVGVSHVLSILDPEWPVPEAFGSFGEHAKLELRFHDVIDERGGETIAPQPGHVSELLAFGRSLQTGEHLLVHCHAGVSRSTAAMALILAQACPAATGAAIFAKVLQLRPRAWPNLRIIEFGDALLGRDGALIAAAVEVYGRQLADRHYVEEAMRGGGRGREVDAAMNRRSPA
jgi:predicted protein tyrosine phosphatase